MYLRLKILWAFLLFRVIVLHASTLGLVEIGTVATGDDSIRAFRIGEVTVVSPTVGKEYSTAPLQIMDQEALKLTSAQLVSDALRYFSGVTVKDYGGLGGIKTISIRSLGAQHTAVAYDGIVLTDCQTGQLDLGRFSLENVEQLQLNIGDGNSIFQPARAFASSALLTIQSQLPKFEKGKGYQGSFRSQIGSFGSQDYSLSGNVRINKVWSLGLNTQVQQSKGNYPYSVEKGGGNVATYTRQNNEVSAFRFESMLMAHLDDQSTLQLKTYHYESDRELPGAVILYNTNSNQMLWDDADFIQAHYQTTLKEAWSWQLNAKYNRTSQHYLNPNYLGATGEENFQYQQEEVYLSSAWLYQLTSTWSFSVSTDAALAKMDCNLSGFVVPSRYTLLGNAALKYISDRIIVTSGVLGTGIHETTLIGEHATAIGKLSPSLNISIQPFKKVDEFRLRTFWKNSFRVPSFNDLYYSAIGNVDLKPENSNQLNFGLTYGQSFKAVGVYLGITADAFQNRITDKIMAIPTRNLFVWSMTNVGKVDIKGIDFNLEIRKKMGHDFVWNSSLGHSYQKALDLTDVESKTYEHQIAYAPRIYGSFRSGISWKEVVFGYSVLYSGHRYVTGQNLAENNLEGYTDHGITLSYGFKKMDLKWNVRLDVQNVMGSNYEIVRNFPMPGRMCRLSAQIDF